MCMAMTSWDTTGETIICHCFDDPVTNEDLKFWNKQNECIKNSKGKCRYRLGVGCINNNNKEC